MSRLANVNITYDLLIGLLQGHDMCRTESDMPKDAKVYGAVIDISYRTLVLTVHSASFDEVPTGKIIPNFDPVTTVSTTELAMLADLVSKRHDYCRSCGEPLRDPP